MTNLKWRIGQVEVFQLIELEAGPIIQSIIPNATPENIQNMKGFFPHFADEHGRLKALVQCFLIKSSGSVMLIDTCTGNDKIRSGIPEWSNLNINFLEQIHQAGISETDVNFVACTHFHLDHVGWNTRLVNGAWAPTFPNAKYLFSQKEYETWLLEVEKEISDDKAILDDSIAPIFAAGLAELVDVDHQVDKNIRFIPTLGHTPFHVSLLIESQGESAIISGDFLHHPCQVAHPEWHCDADALPEKAAETRRVLLEKIADTRTLLMGSHFSNPVAGKIEQTAKGLTFKV